MEFKIDTKPSYTVITPASGTLNANLTEAVRQKWEELVQSGSQNLVLDLSNCQNADADVADAFSAVHEEVYSNNQSLVFINIPAEAMPFLKKEELHLVLNIAPTMKEAVDIISMEILERDLFNEES
jgi:anti-anti-sigma regulatory factor